MSRQASRIGASLRVTLWFCALACFCWNAIASGPSARELLSGARLEEESAEAVLADLLAAPRYENARWGVLVCDEPTGSILLKHGEGASFMTASNLKLVSTACALAELGPDYRFRTELLIAGEIRGGTLLGEVILRGGGDPTFGGRFEREPNEALRFFSTALASAGIRRVEGRVLGDPTIQALNGCGDGWAWDYQHAWYAAPLSGLCFRENVFTAVAEWPLDRPQAQWRAEPACSLLELKPLTNVVAGPRSELEFWRDPGTHRYHAHGTLERGAAPLRYDLAVEEPALYAAVAFADQLYADGIRFARSASLDELCGTGTSQRSMRRVAVWYSPPLADIVTTTNTVSQNLYAEQLLLAAAGAAEGRRDMAAARKMFARHLEQWGGDPSECFLADGSGLSRENLVSPRAFLALLRGQLSSEHRELFLNSLPHSGATGTLRSRLRELPAGYEVRAKTGSISLVKGLSGYLLRDGVVRRSFSVLVNDTTRVDGEDVKRDIDRLIQALVTDLAAE